MHHFPATWRQWGRQWFSVEDRSPDRLLAGVETAAPILDGFIESELRAPISGPSKRRSLALAKDDDGVARALRRAEPIAAIVGFSGRLMAAGHIADEIRARPPTLLIHGDADPVVPFESLAEAKEALESVGVNVETNSRPALGHSIDKQGLASGGAFLKEHLGG